MGLFDHLTNHAEELAENIGVPADELDAFDFDARTKC